MPRAARKSRRSPAPIVDPASLPYFLLIDEVAAIYRVNPDTIRRALSLHKFQPLPFEKYPYRWKRDEVLRDLNTPRHKLRTRKHGFAATKAKRELEPV